MTRYERIRRFTMDEMAGFLADIQWDSSEPTAQEMYTWLMGEWPDEGDHACPECGTPLLCVCVIGNDKSGSGLVERIYSCDDCGAAWTTRGTSKSESGLRRYFIG